MPAAPLDSLELAVNLARTRLNDAIANINGDIFTDTQGFTIVYINGGWRRFQETLVSYGQSWFTPEQILFAAASIASGDASAQCFINWANYFNGALNLSSPVLPQNLIAPLVLWERPSGTGQFFKMDRMYNGLPAVPQGTFNKSWEWRNGAIYIPGATQVMDFRLRYAGYYADFLPSGTEAFSLQPIPIIRAYNPLAWFIASEVSKARGDLDTQYFDQQAMLSTKFFFDLDEQQAKGIQNEAELTKTTDRFSATQGPQGPRGLQGAA